MKRQQFQITFILLHILLIFSCNSKTSKESILLKKDSLEIIIDPHLAYWDSLKNGKVDTSTIHGKLNHMKNLINLDLGSTHIEHDTMFDFNYDSYDDIFFRYYGESGSYMKYNTIVCIYNPIGDYFYTNNDLRFPNASFFIDKKKITSFYGGQVREYHWLNKKWELFMEAQYNEQKEEWIVNYKTNKKVKIIKGNGIDNPSSVIEIDLFYK